jgi:soluble lytic murein transglycosylase
VSRSFPQHVFSSRVRAQRAKRTSRGRLASVFFIFICASFLPAHARAAHDPAAHDPAAFRQTWLEPYFSQGKVTEFRRFLQANQPKKAAALLRGQLKGRKPQQLRQARFLLAYALLKSKEQKAVAEAASLFTALVRSYPLLSDTCRFYAARATYRLKNFSEAERLASAIDKGSTLAVDAQLLRADALRAQQRIQESAALLRAYLEKYPNGQQAGRAHFYLAEALAQSVKGSGAKAAGLRLEALAQYRQVLIQTPLWSKRPEAEKRLSALIQEIPDGQRRAQLTPDQRFAQTMVFYQAMRHDEAEAGFQAVLKEKGLSPAMECKARHYLAKTIFRRRERGRAVPFFEAAEKACRKAGELDWVVKSLFDEAKGLYNAQEYMAAIDRFGAIEKEFSGHSYADDARLWAAEIYEKLKRKDDVTRLLSTLPELYPKGDMARDALWRLARLAYFDKDYATALKYLDWTQDKLGRAGLYYAQGQAPYWKARILELTGRPPDEAREMYERCIREYPLSYYALMAFNRLRETHGALYGKLYRELIDPIGTKKGTWSFAPSELFARPGFLRGVELARLGLGELAQRELAKVGLSIQARTSTENLWLAAVLYDRAGLWELSHQVGRSLDTAYRRSYPLQENYRRWALAYPKAFHPLVPLDAQRSGLPWTLVQAVMREESGFSTTIESYANAVGLMQLILPTARTAGSLYKLEVTRESLRDPVQNIKLGASYLGFLMRTFSTLPLVIAGYNAGEGAVGKWLRELGQVPLDELIERIPYDQTRRYTKRVLSSVFTYAVLYGQGAARVPRLGQRLPPVKKGSFGKK